MENCEAKRVSYEVEMEKNCITDDSPQAPVEEGSRPDVDMKQLRNLNADLLTEVFAFLPQRCLFEVMSVSRHWEQAVREESSSLWKKVSVIQWHSWWGTREMKNQMLSRLLKAAEEVRFMENHYRAFPSSVSEVLGQSLRVIELPQNIELVTSAFFHTLLSTSPELRQLLVKGEPMGEDLLQISHPKLEVVELQCVSVRPLSINCPNLTHLSTAGDASARKEFYTKGHLHHSFLSPSLNCPHLTNLYLSHLHCAEGVLESMAAHAPGITNLYSYSTSASPIMTSSLFRSLRALSVKDLQRGDGLCAFHTYWPQLESLCLDKCTIMKCEVHHPGLKSLVVAGFWQNFSLKLTCPALEYLHLKGQAVTTEFADNLNVSCPRLKTLRIKWVFTISLEEIINKDVDEDCVLTLFHETLEDLDVKFSSPRVEHLHIECPQLTKLIVRSEQFWERDLNSLDLPNLTTLQLSRCPYVCLSPSILSILPRLKRLQFLEHPNKWWTWRQVELEHSFLPNVAIEVVGDYVMSIYEPPKA